MVEITIAFSVGNDLPVCEDFDVESGLLSNVEDYRDSEGFDDWEVYEYDDDYPDPDVFDDLDEYAEIVNLIEEHGEAYRLRYEDIGKFDFDDEYNGCWDSEEDFAHDLFESCYNIPDFIKYYVDWESVTRDVMYDYSSYEGSEGYHIFRN